MDKSDADQPGGVVRLLTVKDVLAASRISTPSLWREINEDKLRTLKIRGRRLVHPDDYEAWLNSCRVTGGGRSNAA